MAHVLCRELTRFPSLVAGQKVLEVGSGCGLCGIVAALIVQRCCLGEGEGVGEEDQGEAEEEGCGVVDAKEREEETREGEEEKEEQRKGGGSKQTKEQGRPGKGHVVLTDYELPVLRNLRSCMHLNLGVERKKEEEQEEEGGHTRSAPPPLSLLPPIPTTTTTTAWLQVTLKMQALSMTSQCTTTTAPSSI
mmetsp:Transcript_5652/g.10725  ORF Transcript_5652/g.10725 Transcript_5652/m.10725 type:complete len:191 (+) Transcript_5652:1308-1880(+)